MDSRERASTGVSSVILKMLNWADVAVPPARHKKQLTNFACGLAVVILVFGSLVYYYTDLCISLFVGEATNLHAMLTIVVMSVDVAFVLLMLERTIGLFTPFYYTACFLGEALATAILGVGGFYMMVMHHQPEDLIAAVVITLTAVTIAIALRIFIIFLTATVLIRFRKGDRNEKIQD